MTTKRLLYNTYVRLSICNLFLCFILETYVCYHPGIYRYKTMVGKIMYIANDDTQNKTFCKLKLVVETFEHLTLWKNNQNSKVPKVVKPTNKKTLLQNFGDYCTKQPIVPLFSGYHPCYIRRWNTDRPDEVPLPGQARVQWWKVRIPANYSNSDQRQICLWKDR